MRTSLLFTVVGLLALAITPAKADVYNFTSDHCSAVATGPNAGQTCDPTLGGIMGTVTVTDNVGGSVHVLVQLNAGYQFVSTGAGAPQGGVDASFFFRLLPVVGGPTITYSNITPSNGWSIPNVIGTDQQAAGSYAGDGLSGQFEYALACNPPGGVNGCDNGGSNPEPPPLSFDVTGSGVTAASFNDTGDASGSPFAADVISPSGATGLIDASLCTNCTLTTETITPEPASIFLLGGVLVGVVTGIRRKRAQRNA